jgi:hypothetical protein
VFFFLFSSCAKMRGWAGGKDSFASASERRILLISSVKRMPSLHAVPWVRADSRLWIYTQEAVLWWIRAHVPQPRLQPRLPRPCPRPPLRLPTRAVSVLEPTGGRAGQAAGSPRERLTRS